MIRVGLVGFGLGGRVFHAPLLSSVEGLELAAVLERSSDNAAARYPGIATCRSLDAMLADPSLTLFVVSTPAGSHFDLARQILEAGRNVVVDKPMCTTSSQVAQLMDLASARGALLVPFHNRRWDSDFQTIQKLIHEGSLGHLVHFQSCFDRWSPGPTRRPWKDDPTQGALLLDLGTHLADQALLLFGKPEAVSCESVHERECEGANDSFSLRLRYPGFRATLSANCLSTLPRPRFHLRGTKGNYVKWGLDPQEPALAKVTRVPDAPWPPELPANWGTLSVDVDGGIVTRPVSPSPGDYSTYYAGIRDALLGKSPAPVEPIAAWRVARLLEWAADSATERREIPCDWTQEPAVVTN
jgi:predicted dehydrogenase